MSTLAAPSPSELFRPKPINPEAQVERRHNQNVLTLSRGMQEYFNENFDDLPEGYGFVGGMARLAAFDALREQTTSVRDFDLVAFPELGAADDPEQRRALSKELMPDDFAHGYGVKEEADITRYFASRDFTLNQVAVVKQSQGWQLYYSDHAAADIKHGAIRPTHFEHNEDRFLGQKLIVKAMLLEQVLRRDGINNAHVAGVDLKKEIGEGGLSPFWLGLGLQKAFEWGGDMPERFVTALIKYQHSRNLDPQRASRKVLEVATDARQEADFEFRGVAKAELDRREQRVWVVSALAQGAARRG